jgi:aryl-alcohol dehydrogenase-like predicted oxidoreductase
MPFRQIEIPALRRKLCNIMAHPSSANPEATEPGLDEYSRLGGNCIHCHGEGGETHSRRITGQWLQSRGLRTEFFVCTQICHEGWDEAAQLSIDRFTAAGVREDVATDLDLLATDYLDLIYLDDSPQAPLEPVIDAVGQEIRSGRVKAFGVRNWTAERIAAANSHLSHERLPRVAAIITTELALAFSLAPLWPGYLPFGAELQHLVVSSHLPVFAHGADLTIGQCLYADADALSRMRRHWVERWNHPANTALIRRVQCFGEAHRLTSREVNVAWLLNQSFPCVAVLPLPSFLLAARRTEYETASQLVLEEGDRDLLCGRASTL